jgi:hypothetical protein
MDAVKRKLERLGHLDSLLSKLDKRREAYETEMARGSDIDRKVESEDKLKCDVLPKIVEYERERGQLLSELADLASESNAAGPPEAEAQVIVGEIVRTISQVETDLRADERFEEMMGVLRQIQDRLNAPGKTAAAKLKVELPILPTLVKYEMEVDTEAALGVLKGLRERAFRLFRKALADPR